MRKVFYYSICYNPIMVDFPIVLSINEHYPYVYPFRLHLPLYRIIGIIPYIGKDNSIITIPWILALLLHLPFHCTIRIIGERTPSPIATPIRCNGQDCDAHAAVHVHMQLHRNCHNPCVYAYAYTRTLHCNVHICTLCAYVHVWCCY